MINATNCFAKYGDPSSSDFQARHMRMWILPAHLQYHWLPKRIFCNLDLIAPLEQAFTNLVNRDLIGEMKTFDGCFNVRKIRGYENSSDPKYYSLHSWGIAVDINGKDNPLGKEPKLSGDFVKCFLDAGFDWGGAFKRKDGMHFQLSKI